MTNSIVLYFILVISQIAFSQEVAIPFDTLRLPANDLLIDGSSLSPESALIIKKNQVDLSTLSPKVNSLWNPSQIQESDYDQQVLTLSSGSSVDFEQIITSYDGMLRFNVKNREGQYSTVYMDPKMHVAHLRKNLLRKLGYQIPAIKRLQNLEVHFKSPEEKEEFKKQMRWRVDLIHAKRWIQSEDELSLIIRDISIIESSSESIYNSALGVPPGYQETRTLRALLLPYALCDLPESINQLTWFVGRVDENKLILPYFFEFADFNSVTIDDLKWIAHRLSKLSKLDFEQIVIDSHYPSPVAEILVEKLLSRKLSLLKHLGIKDESINTSEIDKKKTIEPYLKNGVILKKDWTDQGYATEFSSSSAPSPFKNFHYYFLATLQKAGMDTLINRANRELEAFDINKARNKLAEKQFYEGLDHFVQTGELLQFPISAWISPELNGNLILSRDIVIGNYLGTDNLVQLADTFGFAARAGVHVGLENFKAINSTYIRGGSTFTKTYTHLKPLQDLKTVFREPYKNMIVPILKLNMRKHLKDMKNVQSQFTAIETTDERIAFLDNLLSVISKNLGVGESLIITERWSHDVAAGTKIPVFTPMIGAPVTVRLAGGVGQATVKRLQILRKDPKTLQIFDDKGDNIFTSFSLDLEYYIPILRLKTQSFKGDYTVLTKNINIKADLSKNPDFFDNLEALNMILKKENMKSLSDDLGKNQINQIKGSFSDKLNSTAFLFWRRKRLKAYTEYSAQVSQPNLTGEYVSYRDHIQTGKNWQSMLKDMTVYFLRKKSQDVAWANQIWQNPSDTVGGMSKTFESDYEAVLDGQERTRDFISFTQRAEGWSKKESKLIKFAQNINDEHGLELFTPEMFEQIKKLNLYDIFSRVNIYEAGIKYFKNLGVDKLVRFAYSKEQENLSRCEEIRYRTLSDGTQLPSCGYMSSIIGSYETCSKKDSHHKKDMKCWLLLIKNVYRSFNMETFSMFFGRENIYAYAQVNGFRKDSEIFNEPIRSNGYGRQDPRQPDGVISLLRGKLDIPQGELEGHWLRERL